MIKRSESFGSVAKAYQKYRISYNLKIYKLLASLLGGGSKQYKILDIGCGTGKSTEPLAKFFKQAKIVGCDPDKGMLVEAIASAKRSKLPIKYTEGHAEKMPFVDDYFDAVIAGTAMHWFGTAKALKEIGRVLKKDGLLFVFWNIFREKDGVVDWKKMTKKYKWRRTSNKFKDNPESLKLLFWKTGFEKIKIARIPFIEARTAEKMIGGLKTNSSYQLLSAAKKEEFIKEMKDIYKKFGKKKIISKREVFICYGFKK